MSRRLVRRRTWIAVAALALLVGMAVSVRRGAEGRRLAGSIAELAQDERRVRMRVVEARLRVDSLESRDRILEVAPRLGLRRPDDDEVKFLPDVIDAVAMPTTPGQDGRR